MNKIGILLDALFRRLLANADISIKTTQHNVHFRGLSSVTLIGTFLKSVSKPIDKKVPIFCVKWYEILTKKIYLQFYNFLWYEKKKITENKVATFIDFVTIFYDMK